MFIHYQYQVNSYPEVASSLEAEVYRVSVLVEVFYALSVRESYHSWYIIRQFAEKIKPTVTSSPFIYGMLALQVALPVQLLKSLMEQMIVFRELSFKI